MSSSLVKKSLELFKDDVISSEGTKKKKKKDPMKMISSKKWGIKKEIRQLKQKQELERQIKLKTKRSKSAIVDVKKKNSIDNTLDNLYKIQKLKKLSSTSSKDMDLIMEHSKGKLSKNRPTKESAKEEESVFTDRDFDIFEKESNLFI